MAVWCLAGYERLFGEAVQRLQQLGGLAVPIDFEPFATTANLLYTSAFLAERYSGVRDFLEAGQVRIQPPALQNIPSGCISKCALVKLNPSEAALEDRNCAGFGLLCSERFCIADLDSHFGHSFRPLPVLRSGLT